MKRARQLEQIDTMLRAGLDNEAICRALELPSQAALYKVIARGGKSVAVLEQKRCLEDRQPKGAAS